MSNLSLTPGRAGGAFTPLRVLAFSSLAAALLIVGHALLVAPLFRRSIVDDAVREAVRDGVHIRRSILAHDPFGAAGVREALRAESRLLAEDYQMIKLRLFDASGRIVLSTVPAEEGTLNEHAYFRERVARGEVVSEVVWEKQVSLEGQVVPRDVVEVYLPIVEGGVFRGACEIYYDVSARKTAMDGLLRQTLSLTAGGALLLLAVIGVLAHRAAAAAREEARLQEQLIRADRLAALGTLVGGMAHEFNNINVSVMGFSELALERADLAPEVRDFLQRIFRASRRARAITNNLLDFSQMRQFAFAPAALSEPVRAALDLVRSQYEKEGVRLEERIGAATASLLDQDLMVQVFLNLLTNARHALIDRPDPLIVVEVAAEPGWAVARVSDNGCGIPAARQSQVFTPFFSTKGEHAAGGPQSRVKGTGLGLSVCHTIVKSHRGEILVESAEGRGTTFTVRVPVLPDSGGGGDG